MKTKFINQLCLFILLFFSNLSAQEELDSFNIVVLSDIHISNDKSKDERLLQLIEKINSGEISDVKFVVVTGDFVSAIYQAGKERTDENSRLSKGISIMNNLTVPYYINMGNHDYKIDNERDSDIYFPKTEIIEMEKLWKNVTGFDKYFAIKKNEWNFIFLNSMRGQYDYRFFDNDQLQWLSSLLKKSDKNLLFFHHPVQSDNISELHRKMYKDLITPEKEPYFFDLLKQYKESIKGIFFGHVHIWLRDKLFKTIPTFLTNSFADQSGLPFHLVKIDLATSEINVIKKHLKLD